jgi:hypothetical protein
MRWAHGLVERTSPLVYWHAPRGLGQQKMHLKQVKQFYVWRWGDSTASEGGRS